MKVGGGWKETKKKVGKGKIPVLNQLSTTS
jgi:hypothetical protein